MPSDAPIRIDHFPPNVLTFHIGDIPLDLTVQVRDAPHLLIQMRDHFLELDPKEQRNFIIALIVERM